MSFKYRMYREMGYSIREILGQFKDYLALKLACRLPKSVVYWSFINVGIDNIKNDEIVPEVSYITILQRYRKATR